MKLNRTGKIARLPRVVREELNRRLADGESGTKLLGWLNGLPEVLVVLKAEFEGKAIGKQNLWAWKQGGYRDWERREDAMELAGRFKRDAQEIADRTSESRDGKALTETMTLWVAGQFGIASRHVVAARGKEHWRLLRQMCGEVMRLRGGEQSQERMRLQERRMELQREKLEFRRARGKEPARPAERAEAGGVEEAELMRLMKEMLGGECESDRRAEGGVVEPVEQAGHTNERSSVMTDGAATPTGVGTLFETRSGGIRSGAGRADFVARPPANSCELLVAAATTLRAARGRPLVPLESSGSRRLNSRQPAASLKLQQPALALQPSAVARQSSVGADDAVARDHN